MTLYDEVKQAFSNGNILIVNQSELQEAIRLRDNGYINFLQPLECEDKPNHYQLLDLKPL